MKVVICVDGSDTAFAAFKWYCSKFNQRDNEITIVHAGDQPNLPSFVCYEEAVFPMEEFDRCVAKSKAKVEALKKKFLDQAQELRVECQFHVLLGDGSSPGEALIKFLDNKSADVVVMGTRGQGTLRRTILGSVSDYLVHHARIPVLIFREK